MALSDGCWIQPSGGLAVFDCFGASAWVSGNCQCFLLTVYVRFVSLLYCKRPIIIEVYSLVWSLCGRWLAELEVYVALACWAYRVPSRGPHVNPTPMRIKIGGPARGRCSPRVGGPFPRDPRVFSMGPPVSALRSPISPPVRARYEMLIRLGVYRVIRSAHPSEGRLNVDADTSHQWVVLGTASTPQIWNIECTIHHYASRPSALSTLDSPQWRSAES